MKNKYVIPELKVTYFSDENITAGETEVSSIKADAGDTTTFLRGIEAATVKFEFLKFD
ncbi:MAG: hypothetical protein ACI4EA_06930 [Candidatus Ornithomonoglobus sp.]